jgi:2-keto-4-pentenoate hydratase
LTHSGGASTTCNLFGRLSRRNFLRLPRFIDPTYLIGIHASSGPYIDSNMSLSINVRSIAAALLDARASYRPLAASFTQTLLADTLRTVGDGYAVQNEMIRMVSDQQGKHPLGSFRGWKIGATNAQAQAALGFGPFYGPLFSTAFKPPSSMISLSQLGAGGFSNAEGEVMFVMREDVPQRNDGRDHSPEEVWTKVGQVGAAIELCAKRVPFALPPPLLLADFAINAAVIPCGTTYLPSDIVGDISALAKFKLSLKVNGSVVGTATGANVLGNPAVALTWLANELNRAGTCLRAGDVVMSGAIANHRAMAPGDVFGVDFEGLDGRPETRDAIEITAQP